LNKVPVKKLGQKVKDQKAIQKGDRVLTFSKILNDPSQEKTCQEQIAKQE
jgi:hypothetical protein